MANISLISFEPSFNRLSLIRYVFENSSLSLIESKELLDRFIDGTKEVVDFKHNSSDKIIEELFSIGVEAKEYTNG